MLRDEMLYIEAEVKTIGTAQDVKDEIARSAFIEAERFTNDRPQKVGSGFAGPAYNFKIADFVPLVNAAQPQRSINRQLEY